MISVLMFIRRHFRFSVKAVAFLPSPSLVTAFIYRWFQFSKRIKDTCEKIHKSSLRQKSKSRYQSASLTVEASVAFPVFFFAVVYLIQMFGVLRAELMIAQAGITSAREAAVFSYAAERLADGENATAQTLLEIFDREIVRDATMTGVFYARCDSETLRRARVAQGLGGMWVNTEEDNDKQREEIYYRVKPSNVLTPERGRYYVLRIVYRNWTGEGRMATNEEETTEDTVYMTEHGSVYHFDRYCSYIRIVTEAVPTETVGEERNLSGARYYACEFCSPVLQRGTQVFITEYGTRYHASSTCSAIKRNVRECSREEVRQVYPSCSRCGGAEGGNS